MNLKMSSLISNDLRILRFMGAMRVFVRGNLILAERGGVEDQPQRVDKRNRLGFHQLAAAGRDDTAALRVKMKIAERLWFAGG
jgi:hypothetical protein